MADLANLAYQHSLQASSSGPLARARQSEEAGCRQIAAINGTDPTNCHDVKRDEAIAAARTGLALAESTCPSCGLAEDPGKTTCHALREKVAGMFGGEAAELAAKAYGHYEETRSAFGTPSAPTPTLRGAASYDCR